MLCLVLSLLLSNDPDPAGIDELKPLQDLVGRFDGNGRGDANAGWKESFDAKWKFGKSGRAGLFLKFVAGEKRDNSSFDELLLIYDPELKKLSIKAYLASTGDAEPIKFVLVKQEEGHFVFDRVEKGSASDPVDRIDLKLLSEGDRVVYNVMKRQGKSERFKLHAQVGLNRAGTSLARSESQLPKCVVTGGSGTMTVSYQGQSYPVCCEGCKEAFLANPERYLTAKKKP